MDCSARIGSASMYVSTDLEHPRAGQGIAPSRKTPHFGDPCVYVISNWSENKCIWQWGITSRYQARLVDECGEVAGIQWGACITGSESAGGLGYSITGDQGQQL